MSRNKLIIVVLVCLFIVVNIFLVVKDDSNRVNRVTFLTDWTEVIEKTMYEKQETSGVLDYMEEELVYLDEANGGFNEFLVEEGESVSQGDELYSYHVQNYYEIMSRLDEQKEQVKSDILAVKNAIKKMGKMTINKEIYRFVYPDDKEAGKFKQNTSGAELLKQQYIIEKEKELAENEAELKSIESQLMELTTGKDTIVVESPYEGKVTNISKGLENPLITIESPELYVVGELKEKERMMVENGMTTEVRIKENGQLFEGNITEISEEPKNVSLKGTSIYPFYVLFSGETEAEDDLITVPEAHEMDGAGNAADGSSVDKSFAMDELLQGYHTDVAITLSESVNATAVPEKLIKDSSIWMMTGDGKLLKQPVKTGIEDDGYIEITSDVMEKGDRLALDPKGHFRAQSTFITPLKPSNANWKAIYKNGARKRSVLIGLLGR